MLLNSLYKASITLIPNSDKDITKKKITLQYHLNIDAKIKKNTSKQSRKEQSERNVFIK